MDLPLGPIKQIIIHAVEGRGSPHNAPTFRPTRICKSAINWLDNGNDFSGIGLQTDCL